MTDGPRIGILFSVFLFIDGAAAWLLGVEFADPVRHSTLAPYAPIGLYGGPVLLIAACLLAFLSYYMLAKREPELPRIVTPVPPTQPEKGAAPPTEPAKKPGVMDKLRGKGKEEAPPAQPEKAPEKAPEWHPKDGLEGERIPETKPVKK